MESCDAISVAILGAVIQETKGLFPLLRNPKPFGFLGENFQVGMHENHQLLIGTVGFGKVNAAITTAALLERFPVKQVWHVGCAGAFAEGQLEVGDVLISHEIICGDEGVLLESESLSNREIGIPILKRNEEKFYDRIPVDDSIIHRIRDKTPAGCYTMPRTSREGEETGKWGDGEFSGLPAYRVLRQERAVECFQVAFGSSLTVSMASGDFVTAGKRFQQYGALGENMEGSAVAQTCFRFGVPMVECRGISNMAGNRSKSYWRLEKAVAHCQAMVVNWLKKL